MATHLSWTGYFLALGAAVAIYYVIIGIRYYRQDIRALLNSKSRFWERPEKPPPISHRRQVSRNLGESTPRAASTFTVSLFSHRCTPPATTPPNAAKSSGRSAAATELATPIYLGLIIVWQRLK